MIKLRNIYLLMRHEERVGTRNCIITSDHKKYPVTACGRQEAAAAGRVIRQMCSLNIIYASP